MQFKICSIVKFATETNVLISTLQIMLPDRPPIHHAVRIVLDRKQHM